jgi:hypothetical protein
MFIYYYYYYSIYGSITMCRAHTCCELATDSNLQEKIADG